MPYDSKWVSLLQAAEVAYQSKQPARSEALCRQILKAKPDFSRAMLLLAAIYSDRGEYEAALSLAENALALDESAAAHDFVGGCHANLGNLRAALPHFVNAIRLSPNVSIYHEHLGSVQRRLALLAEAEGSLRRAISLNPSGVVALIGLGQMLVNGGRPAEAVPFLRRAIKIQPTVPEAYVLLGKALGESDSTEETEAMFRKAISLNHRSSTAYIGLGIRLMQLGRFEEAIESYQSAIEIQPNQGAAYGGIVRARKIKETDRPLIDRMEALVAERTLDGAEMCHLRYSLGKAYDDLGEYAKAMPHFQEGNRLSKAAAPRKFDISAYAKEFDLTIERYTKEFIGRNKRTGEGTGAPIFVVGMMRSGTTLVEQIVSSHHAVAAGGEISFWTAHRHEVWERSIFDAISLNRLASEYLQLLRSIANPNRRATDKMPGNFFALGLIHIAFPESPIIHCRRNPADTCLSIYLTPFRASPDYAHDPENIVAFYREYRRLMDHWREVLPPNRFLEVDYEEMIADRESVTKRLLSFCGLDWDPACLVHEKNARAVSTASAWQSRQPLYNTSLERWRNYEPWLGPFASLLPRVLGDGR